MSVSTSSTYMKLQNFRKLGKNAKLFKKRTLPISGQNLFPQWCPLIRDYTVVVSVLLSDALTLIPPAIKMLLLFITRFTQRFSKFFEKK